MPDELGIMAPTSLQQVGVKHKQPLIYLKDNAFINDIGGCHNILYCDSWGNTSHIPRTTLVGPFLKVNHTSYLDKSTHKLMNGSIQQLQPIKYILLKVQKEEGGGMWGACNISPFSYRDNFNATAHLSGTSISVRAGCHDCSTVLFLHSVLQEENMAQILLTFNTEGPILCLQGDSTSCYTSGAHLHVLNSLSMRLWRSTYTRLNGDTGNLQVMLHRPAKSEAT